MEISVRGFGEIEIEGHCHRHDVVIDRGEVRKRRKKNSRPYQRRYGHTPLSAGEDIPWSGQRLIIGTGLYGRLPVMPEVIEESKRRGVEVVAVPTRDACEIISDEENENVCAILHVTC